MVDPEVEHEVLDADGYYIKDEDQNMDTASNVNKDQDALLAIPDFERSKCCFLHLIIFATISLCLVFWTLAGAIKQAYLPEF